MGGIFFIPPLLISIDHMLISIVDKQFVIEGSAHERYNNSDIAYSTCDAIEERNKKMEVERSRV